MSFVKNITLLLMLFISSCDYQVDELQKDKLNPYSISLGSFKTYEQALKYKMTLLDSVRAYIRLESVGKKHYKLFYGKYSSSYKAGEKAFELFDREMISNYEINSNGQKVLDEFANVPFISYYLGKTAVYNYNIKTKNVELLWSRSNQKVFGLSLSPNYKTLFILTAETINRKASFTSVQNAKLYLYYRNEEYSEDLVELGNVNNLYTYWDKPDTFKINITYPDTSNSQLIHQKILSWDHFGRIGNLIVRRYDLLKDGYPSQPNNKYVDYSPNNEMKIVIKEHAELNYYYLTNFNDRSELLMFSSKDKLIDLIWSLDSRFIFFKILESKIMPKQILKTENLIVYDAYLKKTVALFSGEAINNLLVRGKLLFFDEYLNGKNVISIYDLATNKKYDELNMLGGSMLNTINK